MIHHQRNITHSVAGTGGYSTPIQPLIKRATRSCVTAMLLSAVLVLAATSAYPLDEDLPSPRTALFPVTIKNQDGTVIEQFKTDREALEYFLFFSGRSVVEQIPPSGTIIVDDDGITARYLPEKKRKHRLDAPMSGNAPDIVPLPNLIARAYILFCIPFLILAGILVLRMNSKKKVHRRCRHCGYTGEMQAKLLHKKHRKNAVILLLLGIIPGLLYIATQSGKYKCPRCRRTSMNKPFRTTTVQPPHGKARPE